MEVCNHVSIRKKDLSSHIKSAHPDFDPEMFNHFQVDVQKKVDEFMKVIFSELGTCKPCGKLLSNRAIPGRMIPIKSVLIPGYKNA